MPVLDLNKPVGVIGAGSFGTAIANLLAYNVEVLLYSRNPNLVQQINTTHRHFDMDLSPRIKATLDLKEIAETCTLIFPIIPSVNFREVIKQIAPYLRPYHMLIHGTKGFDLMKEKDFQSDVNILKREDVRTMSEIIRQETVVLRVGCLSGPNLAREILDGQPTATVIASKFDEVIQHGKEALDSKHFHVFGTHDLLGAELAGALKNVIAIGSGILKGKGLGKNIQAILVSRGLIEMIAFGKAMGAESKAFFGTAGVGDLVATATSKNSRNFTFGFRLGLGHAFDEIQESMPELAEGVRTLKISYLLAKYYKLKIPIFRTIHNIVFEGLEVEKAIEFLMTYPYDVDVDFL